MYFKVSDYDLIKHQYLDEWINEDLYLNAKVINKYALYNEPLSETYNYIKDNPFAMANIRSFIKVFEHENEVVGVVVLHYYLEAKKHYLMINPIIINPTKMNQGYGTNILRYIIRVPHLLTGGRVDYLRCNLDNDNIVSVKLFTGRGFIKESEDCNFTTYHYSIKKGYLKELIYVTIISLIVSLFYIFLLSTDPDLKGIQMIIAYTLVPLWMFSTLPTITYWVKRIAELKIADERSLNQTDLIVVFVLFLAPYYMVKYYKEHHKRIRRVK